MFFFVEFYRQVTTQKPTRVRNTGTSGEAGKGVVYFRRRAGGEILLDSNDSFLRRSLRNERFYQLDPPLWRRRNRKDNALDLLYPPTLNTDGYRVWGTSFNTFAVRNLSSNLNALSSKNLRISDSSKGAPHPDPSRQTSSNLLSISASYNVVVLCLPDLSFGVPFRAGETE